eukprot:1155170-Pelagomonas_calceolata.AAC.4
MGMVAVEDASPLTITDTGDPSEPIPTPFAFPKWQPPELQESHSDRSSWGSKGSVEDEPSPNDPASRLKSTCQRWLTRCLLWILPFPKVNNESPFFSMLAARAARCSGLILDGALQYMP